ncbi:MAG: AsnC family transcriptional regulator [Gammaproteobacteria bacterium]|nr:AsnC family transcriptional regulator [Gammaproteobacteria bacterium]
MSRHPATVVGDRGCRPDAVDRRIIAATQAGLPLTARPYDAVAERLGLPAAEVRRRLRYMMACGVIRRIALVPNHYRLGYRANAMSVWDLPDTRIHDLGQRVAALPFVSHCYHRRRQPPIWPYNLFAMVHGHNRDETEAMVDAIADLLGEAVRGRAVLYSSRILKKTGLRLPAPAALSLE